MCINDKWILAVVTLGFLALPLMAQPHHHDVVIGRSSLNVLKVEAPEDPTVLLPTAPGFPLPGWSGIMPGFEALEEDEPGEDFYKLQPGALIELEVLELHNGLRVFNNFLQEVQVGQRWQLGNHELHTHGLWLIDRQVNPDPELTPAVGRFMVHDVGTTGYGPSQPFELVFTPEPGSGLALTWLVLALTARRR